MTAVGPPMRFISHYRLLEQFFPSSGPGDLSRARDTRLGRTVAIRLLPAGFSSSAVAHQELLQRARAMLAVSHPNVTAMFDVGEHEGRVFVAFEYLQGQTLRAEMGAGRFTIRRALDVSIQLAEALAGVHGAGFIHRGLSPETIVVTSKGRIKIPSFDLATLMDGDTRAECAGLPHYAAPEDSGNGVPDELSNIYSAGAILYEMLTASRPPHQLAPTPSAMNRHVPQELDDLVLRTLAPVRESRLQSAGRLAAALRDVAATLDRRGSMDPDEEQQNHARSMGSSVVVWVGAAFLLVVLALVWWLIW